jgi:hypothetical protein
MGELASKLFLIVGRRERGARDQIGTLRVLAK